MTTAVLFQSMPPLSPEEYAALEASIAANGMQVPVIVDEHGVTIDGHHRRRIAESLGVECPTVVRDGLTEAEKRTLALSLNVDRRHLSREQRRDLIAASLKADPQLSNSEHARRTGASDKTVDSVRSDLVERSEIPNVSERVDSTGRQQPATKPEREPEPDPDPLSDSEAARQAEQLEAEVTDDEPALTEADCEALADAGDLDEPEPRPDGAPGPRAQVNQQIRLLNNVADRLAGYASTLQDTTELYPAVTKEEAARLAGSFSKGIRSLNRIKRLLEERASTQEES